MGSIELTGTGVNYMTTIHIEMNQDARDVDQEV